MVVKMNRGDPSSIRHKKAGNHWLSTVKKSPGVWFWRTCAVGSLHSAVATAIRLGFEAQRDTVRQRLFARWPKGRQ